MHLVSTAHTPLFESTLKLDSLFTRSQWQKVIGMVYVLRITLIMFIVRSCVLCNPVLCSYKFKIFPAWWATGLTQPAPSVMT